MLRTGVGIAPIVFPLPIKKLTHQCDPLYVKALRMEDYMIISIDATSAGKEAVQYLQGVVSSHTGITKDHIFVSVTHSFSSPHFNHGENYEPVRKALVEAMEQIELQDTRIAYHVDECDINVQKNCWTEDGYWIGRNPDGYRNPEVKSLHLFHGDQEFACIINYDLQSSCVQNVDPTAVSSDIPGVLAEYYRHQGVACLFMPGACADQVPVSDDHEKLGKELYESIHTGITEELSRISVQTEYQELQKQVMKYSTKELTPHKAFDFETLEDTLEISVSLLKINDVTLCMTSPELNAQFGKEIESNLGEKIMVITMVNDAVKYLPQEWDYEHITYTAMNTMIARGSDERLMEVIRRMKK